MIRLSRTDRAARIDPIVLECRALNLAEIPFLKKAGQGQKRCRTNCSPPVSLIWQKEASQLILQDFADLSMEGKSNMVDSILAKLELRPIHPLLIL